MPYAGRLDAVDGISINPTGEVLICWDWSIGNAATQDLGELLDRYDPYAIPKARAILTGGMAALRALAQARGHEPDPAGYDSICDMCRLLRQAGTRPAPRKDHAQE